MSRPSVLSRNRPHRETRTERNWRETHDRIIRGALTEMAIHGIAGATIRGIANRANVATGTFYNHFADVDALLDEVMVDLVVMTDEFAIFLSVVGSSMSVSKR